MEADREVREQKLVNGLLTNNNTCIMCMSCYHTAFLNNVLRSEPVEMRNKIVRVGKCPKCGAEIRQETIFKTHNDEAKEQAAKNSFVMETAELEAKKKSQPFFMLMSDYPTLKYEGGIFYKEASLFNPKKVIKDREFKKFIKQFFQLRAFYKHIARKKFYYSSEGDELNLSKYQYCRKLQNEMIYTICRNKLFVKYWFLPYTKILKCIQKYSKAEKIAFITFVLALGKQVEDFEYLNYELAFGEFDSLTKEELERYNAMQYKSMYTTDRANKWINTHSTLLAQFKAVQLGSDSTREETPVNDGQKAHQLTKELLVEYNKIIAAQKRLEIEQKAKASDNMLLKEIEEEANEEFKNNFIIDV